MSNLYECLGVPKGATDEEIKKAYRKKSMILHPDRDGGNNEAFSAMKKAYEVLSDKQGRAHYDETGEVKDNHKSEDVIRNELMKIFTMVLDTEENIDHIDVIAIGVRVINQNIVNVSREIKKNEGFIKRTAKAMNRMKIKSGKANLFDSLLEQRTNELTRNIERLKVVIETHEKIKAELEEYEYSFDAMPDPMVFFNNYAEYTSAKA